MKKLLVLILVLGMTSAASALNLTITADPTAPIVYVSGGLDRDLYIALLGDGVGADSLVTTLHIPPSPGFSVQFGTEQGMINSGLGFLVPAGFTGDLYGLAAGPGEPYVDGVYITGSGTAGDHAYACWFDTDGGYGVIGTVTLVSLRYVDADATLGANNGMSWADAFIHLQDALDAARSTPSIAGIYVAQGTYRPDQGAGVTSGDRTATFDLINGVTITGGYAGYGEPDPNARDIDAYQTILSGDLSGDDQPDFVNNGENSYHVVTGSGTEPNAILDGFTITGGNADISGGGMYNSYGSPTVTNCTFIANSADKKGGGMYNVADSNTTVNNCIFTGNSAGDSGGGMYNYNYSNPILTNCTFIANLATSGGGLGNYSYSSPTLTNCSFSGNTADLGGGMYNRYFSDPTVTNCIFSGNSADNDGGAMYVWHNCSLALSNCTFSQNSALNGTTLACDDPQNFNPPSTLEITNCILWDGGGEIWNNDGSTITINYSDVEGGWTGPGGNNISEDPLFADPVGTDNIPGTRDDNLHLFDGSPCIDAGKNTDVPLDTFDLDNDSNTTERIPLDIDGEPRFSDDPATPNTGVPDPPVYPDIIDIGADEHSPCGSLGRPYLPADINHDCTVDFLDVAIIGDFWLRRY
jgi:hypothetical protein